MYVMMQVESYKDFVSSTEPGERNIQFKVRGMSSSSPLCKHINISSQTPPEYLSTIYFANLNELLFVPQLLIIGGSFGLREFAQVRYDVQKVKRKIDPALEAQLNKNKNKVSVESEYEKLQQQNLDDWVNIRGPRPWEDSKSYQEQQRKSQNANSIINVKH
ncbi:uncharacterized protein LOC125483781 [Rhincodon typus]|uniref:uncharacterized protein LOC125483781 n=1 Tax=Rhincodon typus TaxID=259920 RepID=UPI00202DF7F5|nr:uncharacterized protein LOC125483781 [Rhincodon typus]